MKQQTEILIKVRIEYDDDVTTEGDAQLAYLEATPDALHTEIVAGLVDADGVPVQPAVRTLV